MKHIQFIQKSILLTVIVSFFNTVNAQDTIVFSAQAIEPTQLSKAVPITSAGVGEPVYFAFSMSIAELREAKPGEVYLVALNFDVTGLKIDAQAVFPIKKTETNKGIYSVGEVINGRLYGKGMLVPQTGTSPEYFNSPYYYNSFYVNNDLYETLYSFSKAEVNDKKRVAQINFKSYQIDFFNTMSKEGTTGPLIKTVESTNSISVQLPGNPNYDELMKVIDAQREANYKIIAESALQNAPAHEDYYMDNYDPSITNVTRKEVETLINKMYTKKDPTFQVIKLSNPSEVQINRDDYNQILSRSFQVDYLAKEGSGKCAYATIILKSAYAGGGTYGPYYIDYAGYKRCACEQ